MSPTAEWLEAFIPPPSGVDQGAEGLSGPRELGVHQLKNLVA